MDKINRTISKKFWEKQAHKATDPRSVTLDRSGAKASALQVRCFQNWLWHHADKMGCQWNQVVDLGCGNGQWSFELAQRAKTLLAIDLSGGFIEHCQKKAKEGDYPAEIEFLQHDVVTAPLPSNCDLIVFGAIAQYLDDSEVQAVFRNVHNALGDDGLFYFRTTVSRKRNDINNCTDNYQALYRRPERYDEFLQESGFTVHKRSLTTGVMSDELARMSVGSTLLPSLGWLVKAPVAAGWNLHRRLAKDIDVLTWIATKA